MLALLGLASGVSPRPQRDEAQPVWPCLSPAKAGSSFAAGSVMYMYVVLLKTKPALGGT